MSLKLEINKSILKKEWIVFGKMSGYLGKNKVDINFVPYIEIMIKMTL